MAEEEPVRERETVVVDKDEPRTSNNWVWAVIVILIIIALFFVFGGPGWFSGGTTSTPSTSVTAPTGTGQ